MSLVKPSCSHQASPIFKASHAARVPVAPWSREWGQGVRGWGGRDEAARRVADGSFGRSLDRSLDGLLYRPLDRPFGRLKEDLPQPARDLAWE